MTTGRINKWFALEGDTVTAGDPLFEIETDKAAMEIEAPATGTLAHVTGAAGVDIAVGATVAWIYPAGEALTSAGPQSAVTEEQPEAPSAPIPKTPPSRDENPPPATNVQTTKDKPRATPLARRLAREAGIKLDAVQGSGPRGRITKSDIEQWSPRTTPNSLAPFSSMQAVPQFSLSAECQIDAAIALAAELTASAAAFDSDRYSGPSVEITVNDLLIKALAAALHAVPQANVTWTEEAAIHHSNVDIAVTIAISGGQVTPVIKEVQGKSVSVISSEFSDLTARATSGGLDLAVLSGGTAAFCNLGMPGVGRLGEHLSPPHTTSLHLGGGERRPVYAQDGINVVGKTLIQVTLSVDQRIIDGHLATRLLEAFKGVVEEPLLIVV